MAKASIPGRSKTRLVPPLTFTEACDFNTAFLRDVTDNIAAAAREAPIHGYVAFGPPESAPFFSRQEFANAPIWSGADAMAISPGGTIQIGLTRH